MTMFPSACVWSYKVVSDGVLKQIQETAFHYIDIEPDVFTVPALRQVQRDLGLKISCVALDRKLPPGCSLGGKDPGSFRKALEYIKQAIERSRSLGARIGFVSPRTDKRYLKPFALAIKELADAAQRGFKLCIEHVPGGTLPSAKEALAFVEKVNHPDVYLLLDVGHTILSQEKPWEIVFAAGKRLGYVQMNDNDGKKDRHWPLLDGKLTYDDLSKTIDALNQVGYSETIGLELSSSHFSPSNGFSRNRNLLLRLQETVEPRSLLEPEVRRRS